MNLRVGNNGNQLVDVLHFESLIKDGQSSEDIIKIARPYMVNEKNFERDDFWEDVFYRAEELGYKLKF